MDEQPVIRASFVALEGKQGWTVCAKKDLKCSLTMNDNLTVLCSCCSDDTFRSLRTLNLHILVDIGTRKSTTAERFCMLPTSSAHRERNLTPLRPA